MIEHLLDPLEFASVLTRLMVGSIFFIQGYDKVFKIGNKEVFTTIQPAFKKIGMPNQFTNAFTFITSWIEMLGGLLLIIGLFKYLMIYLLGIDLLIVLIGMSLIDPVMDLKLIFPRFILLLILLLLPREADVLCLDNFIF